jgi:hypothetical protein
VKILKQVFSQFFPVYRDNKTFLNAPKVLVALAIGSEYASRGQWPWLVPLLKNDSDKFFCGSTIVSEMHLLTGKILLLLTAAVVNWMRMNF